VTATWSQAPWWIRAWLVLSGFLAISSVASLAEAVTKWKGFIGDAISFYRQWISGPFKEALSAFLNVQINPLAADGAILGFIFTFSFIRLLWFTTDWSSKKGKYSFWLTSILLVFGPIIAIYRASNRSTPPSLTLMLLGVIVILAAPAVFRVEKAIIYYLQILFVLGGVAILAAINVGLLK
jgi:hypothetical protein